MRALVFYQTLFFVAVFFTACKPKEDRPTGAMPAHLEKALLLCFHDVLQPATGPANRRSMGRRKGRYSISFTDFQRILGLFESFRVVSLRDWIQGLHPEDPRLRIVLTFDDGYASHREIVLPELTRRGYGATFYFYADQLKNDRKWQAIMKSGVSAFDFGSHSWSHKLMRDATYEEVFRELYLAREFMQSLTGSPLTSFAWPYGYYDESGISAARSAGFSEQVSVDYRVAKRSDIAKVIPRYTIMGKNSVTQVQQILANYNLQKQ